MSIARIFHSGSLALNADVQLNENASHHVARVLRATVGDKLTLFNGEGGEYLATIIQINKKNIIATTEKFIDRDTESPVEIILAQGIARGEKMDFIVQKAVELGVKKIIPLITERCNVRLDNEREQKRLQHWQSIIISACEQSGRNYVPAIVTPITFNDCVAQVQAEKKFILSPHVTPKLTTEKISTQPSVLLLIGPEGGLSDKEIELSLQKDYLPLNLGPRVLRTETATIAALAIFQALIGDMV